MGPSEPYWRPAPALGALTVVAYWAAAQYRGQREQTALRFLGLAGFTVWLPRIRLRRVVSGRKRIVTPALFPGYLFVFIELQWHEVRRCPGVTRLVMDGDRPAQVPDRVIAAYGPDGMRPRATVRNSAPSGQLVGS